MPGPASRSTGTRRQRRSAGIWCAGSGQADMDHGAKHPGDALETSLVSHAVVVGTKAGGEAVVGGLPLAARAVLTLREAGFEVSLVGVAHLGQTRAWLD